MTAIPCPPDRVILRFDDRRDAVLGVIRGAKARLTLSLFRCNDRRFFDELRAAVHRGVDVEVLVTPRAKGGRSKLRQLWGRLEATGARVVPYNDPVVKYHAKYIVADDGPALIASLNFTRKCFTRTCDAIVLTSDPAIVQGLRALMAADRDGRPIPDGLSPRLIVGPERARRQFTTLIESARTSVQIIDPKLSDPAIVLLLNQRRREGLRVDVHGDRQVAGMRSHGKILLVDGTQAVIGSMALAAMSLDFRREVAVAVEDPAAVAVIARWFHSIATVVGASGRAVTPAARS